MKDKIKGEEREKRMEEKDPKTRKEKKGLGKGGKSKKGEFGKYTAKAARIKLQHGNVHKYVTEIQFGENFHQMFCF